MRAKESFVQINSTPEWIIWETAASPQSLLLEGDRLWVGSHGGGLYRWHVENGYESQFTAADGLPGHDVVALALDGSGQKLVATLDGGLAAGNSAFADLAAPTGPLAWDVAVESDGSTFWLASLGGGVARYSGGAWTTYDSLSSTLPFDDVYAVAVDGNDQPWIGTIGYGAAVFDGNTWLSYTLPVSRAHPITPTTLFANNAINDIAIDSSGNKWFATDGSGVAVLDSANANWTVYDTTNSGLPDDFVYAITIVGDERWFGTLGGGVARLDTTTNTWDVWQTGNSPLPDDDVLATAVDANGGAWFATYDTGLTYHGPLPATPYLLNADPRRAPTYTPGHVKGYYLWLDPATYTWYVAWSGDGQPHTFAGSIAADGPILSVTPAGLEAGDSVSVLSNTLSISATEAISQDVVSFVLDRSVTELSLSLQIDGAYRPFNIRVGQQGALPATAPFRLSTPQPQPPQVEIRAGQTLTEGESVYLLGVFTDTDSFTGHEIVWQLEDGSIMTDTLGFSRTYNDDGLFDITLIITDVNGAVGQDSHTVTVLNAPPSVFPDYTTIQPVVGELITFTGSIFDPGLLDTHTYLWDFGDGTTGASTLTVTHIFTATGIYTLTLTVTDDDGGVGIGQLSIYVSQVAPNAVGDTAVTPEDTPVTVDALANDSDPNGDPLMVISLTQPLSGTAVTNLDNTVTYTPALNFNGTDVFTYTVGDDNGNLAAAAITVTVTPVNDAPVAEDDAATTPEDTAVTVDVLANDADVENDSLTVDSVTQPANGTVVINPDHTLTYTPTQDYNSLDSPNGVDSFGYTVQDASGATATAQVEMTVTPVNDPPVAVDDGATTNEDNPLIVAVLANDHDVDGDTIAVSAVTTPTNGSAVINPDNTITYTPATNFYGTATFDYTISDGQGGTDTATVTVLVTPLNDPPAAVDDTAVTDEEVAVTVNVLTNDSDVDGDSLAVTAVTAPANGAVVVNLDHTLTYTPAANFNGADSFAYTISDGQGGEATAVVVVTVNPVNDAPVAADDVVSTDEDTAVTVVVLTNDSDIDGDALTVISVTAPANGTAVINPASSVTYTPAANFEGVDSFFYTISDGNGGSDTAVVTVTVTSLNDNPVAGDDAATTDEDEAVTVDVLANDSDVDGDPLVVSNVTAAANGTVIINPNDTITYIPATNFHGSDSFVYTIQDGNGGADTAVVSITVNPVNDAPVAVDDNATTNEDLPVTVAVLANDSDVDGDTLTVASVTQPAHGAVVINPDNTLTYTPAANFNGSDSFNYTVSDGNGGLDTATVTVSISPVNDAPVAVNDSAVTTEDAAVTVDVLANDFDVDGDTLTVTVVTTPTNGVVVLNGMGTMTYTPDPDFNGVDSFSYTIVDGQGGEDTASVTIAVNPVNDAPVAVDDSATTNEDNPVAVAVLANDSDVDGDSLTVASVTPPANGTAVIQPDNRIVYTPTTNFNGPDSFTYTINDGQGSMDTATVTVNVLSVNDAPQAVNDAVVTPEDTAVTMAVLDNDVDVDGDILTVTAVTTPARGTAAINPDNTITYTPSADYEGPDSFVYTISDGNGGTDTALVIITITSENDNPVAVDDEATTDEDTAVVVSVMDNDLDVDGDTLTVTAVTAPAHGVALLNPGNSITYTPDANFNGNDSFVYTISDGNGGSDTATVTVTVNPVNDAPVATDDGATTNQGTAVTVDVLANDSDVDGDTLSVSAVSLPGNGAVVINADNTVTYISLPDFQGLDSFTYTVSDGQGGSDTALVLVNVLPVTAVCDLYPIALSSAVLDGAESGDVLSNILNGEQPANFGWLTWTGNNNIPALVASLIPPGNSYLYNNPDDPGDHIVSIGDWVEGKPGVSNAQEVRDALDMLIGLEIIVPVWDEVQGSGANAEYRIAGFARVKLLDYSLPGQDKMTVQFLGSATCANE
ncbi:MAG: tandem-95 repeat protein [Chloroflexi bacterium]|nr:tandem-95 repeat protein [Chloroflexota bacterium]